MFLKVLTYSEDTRLDFGVDTFEADGKKEVGCSGEGIYGEE